MSRAVTSGIFTPQTVDRLPIPGTSPDDIDGDKVRSHIERAQGRGRFNAPDNPDEYLAYRGCVAPHEDRLCATTAGLLCFGKDPQGILHHAVVDVGHYRGTEAVSFDVLN